MFWKIQDICYQMGTEIFKIEEERTEKMKAKVDNPPLKKTGKILDFLTATNTSADMLCQ